ncbi:MAG: PAS domain S-box protein [Deltaproteobacteria bacterium]|nr:PAS domain S-box protein [Deltaproteobacteria bacterium]
MAQSKRDDSNYNSSTSITGRFLGAMSMRNKLFTVSISVTIISIILASSLMLVAIWKRSHNVLLQNITSHADMLAENSAAALTFMDQNDAGKLLDALKAVKSIQLAAIYTDKGKVLAVYKKDKKVKIPKHLPVQSVSKYYKNELIVVKKVITDNRTIGYVYINSDLSLITTAFKIVLTTLLITIALVFIVTLLFTTWLQSYVTAPISRLAHVANRIKTEKDFTLRMPRETMDEVGLLADTMNNTLEAIARSEQNYREIFNGIQDAIFVQEPNTGKVLDVNNAALKMYNCTREDILDTTIGFLSSQNPEYTEDTAFEKIQTAKKVGFNVFEWQAKKLTGELFWAEVNLRFSTIGAEGRVLAVVRDISERKRSQEVLVQSEKMMSVGGLAAGIAHEINNPLAGIVQSASVLHSRLTKNDMPANIKAAQELGISMDVISAFMEKRNILNLIENIDQSGKRAAGIVSNMLGFARKSSDESISEDLSDLLDRTVSLAGADYNLKKKYDFKQIKIIREYDHELPKVNCQPSKLQQVFFNILKNGAEAMSDVADKDKYSPQFILRLSHDKNSKSVKIEIEDNGPGMDESISSHIFEPFYTTKDVGNGTGLGLSVSYFIITDNHNGKMHIETSKGHGAKFVITLPI